MGGFFMLLKLMIIRMVPICALGLLKERYQIKVITGGISILYIICFLATVWKIFTQEKWLGLVMLPASLLPHYICYIFALWIMLRCIWHAWSERVWKRVYILSIFSVLLGVLSENYINTKILQIFFKIFK